MDFVKLDFWEPLPSQKEHPVLEFDLILMRRKFLIFSSQEYCLKYKSSSLLTSSSYNKAAPSETGIISHFNWYLSQKYIMVPMYNKSYVIRV